MVVSKFLPMIIFFVLYVSSLANAGEDPKRKFKDFHLELTVEVKTTFAEVSEPKGYPWNKDELIVGCGWVKITYIGYEINYAHESLPITVNIPIGQSCDFSDYVATPLKPKELSLVEWGSEYFFVVGD